MKKQFAIVLSLTLLVCLPIQAQDLYEHFSENPTSKHAKRMLKVFEAIAENKWDNAKKRLAEIEEKIEKAKQKNPYDAEAMTDALTPLPELAHAMIDMAPATEAEGPAEQNAWKAYEKIKRVEKNRYARKIDAFLYTLKDNPLQFSEIIDKMEAQLHEEVAAEHTVEAYDKLLAVLRNNSKIKNQLNKECEQLSYEQVMGSEDIAQCTAYLARFETGINNNHHQKVTVYRDSLAYAKVPLTEQGMRQFLKEYPQSSLAALARKNLCEYAFQGLVRTEKAYKAYIAEFPDSPRREEARDSMISFAWQDAQIEDTYKAYDIFCRNYPQARMINEAKEQRIATGRREFAQLGHKDIPEELQKDSIIANFLRSKTYNIYSRRIYGVHNERIDTVMETIVMPKGVTQRQILLFNEDGLIVRRTNSQKGTIMYEYGVEPGLGFYLVMQTTEQGKILTYTPRFTANGLLVELTASDGSRETYDYEPDGSTFVRHLYAKGATRETQRERYIYGRLVESNKGDVRTTYEYNEHGDIVRRVSNSGTKVLSLTTFDYTYNDEGCWTECVQKGVDGQVQERRKRTFHGEVMP